MPWTDSDPSINPIPRIVACSVAAIGLILLVIAGFYHAPPGRSPYGCYGAAGAPEVRLSPHLLIVKGAHEKQWSVSVRRNNIGYGVVPGFNFTKGKDGSLTPVDGEGAITVLVSPPPAPVLWVNSDGNDVIELRQQRCSS